VLTFIFFGTLNLNRPSQKGITASGIERVEKAAARAEEAVGKAEAFARDASKIVERALTTLNRPEPPSPTPSGHKKSGGS
jgi:hypothetical protein